MNEAEVLARQFHEAYERLAPLFGYETRPETREFDPNSMNGKLMIAVCDELLDSPERERRPAGEPWTEEQMASLRAWAKNADDESTLRRAEEIKAERAAASLDPRQIGERD